MTNIKSNNITNLEILAIRLAQVWATARKTPNDTIKLRNPNTKDSISVVHYWGSFESTTVFNLKQINKEYVITFRGHALHSTVKLIFRNPATLFLLMEDFGKIERLIIESNSESNIDFKKKYTDLFAIYQNPEAVEIMLNNIGEMS